MLCRVVVESIIHVFTRTRTHMHTPHTFTLWTEEQITIQFCNSALLFTGMGSGLSLLCEDFNAQALIPLFNFQVPPQQNPTPVFFIAELVLCGGAAFSAAGAVLVAGPPSGTSAAPPASPLLGVPFLPGSALFPLHLWMSCSAGILAPLQCSRVEFHSGVRECCELLPWVCDGVTSEPLLRQVSAQDFFLQGFGRRE